MSHFDDVYDLKLSALLIQPLSSTGLFLVEEPFDQFDQKVRRIISLCQQLPGFSLEPGIPRDGPRGIAYQHEYPSPHSSSLVQLFFVSRCGSPGTCSPSVPSFLLFSQELSSFTAGGALLSMAFTCPPPDTNTHSAQTKAPAIEIFKLLTVS